MNYMGTRGEGHQLNTEIETLSFILIVIITIHHHCSCSTYLSR